MSKSYKHKFESDLAKWLTTLREEKGLSQEALSIQLGKSQSGIAKIENSSKRLSVIELINWMVTLNVPYERLSEVLEPFYAELIEKNKLWPYKDEL